MMKNKLSIKYDYEEKCIVPGNALQSLFAIFAYCRKFVTFSDLSSVDLGLKTELEFVVYKRKPTCQR